MVSSFVEVARVLLEGGADQEWLKGLPYLALMRIRGRSEEVVLLLKEGLEAYGKRREAYRLFTISQVLVTNSHSEFI